MFWCAVSGADAYSLRAVGAFIAQTVGGGGGARALWRGNTATLLRAAPYAAVNFAAHEQWKQLLYRADYSAADDRPRRDCTVAF